MSEKLVTMATESGTIPMQAASLDIWDSKYRLKDAKGTPIDSNIHETYKRVAKALSEVESNKALQKKWYGEFLWALENGAIPAGRITSNAVPKSTSQRHQRSTAPCQTPSMILWITFCLKCKKPASH